MGLAEVVLSVILICAAVLFLFSSRGLPGSSPEDPLGQRGLPVMVFWVIIGLCVYTTLLPAATQLISAYRARRDSQELTPQKRPIFRALWGSDKAPVLITGVSMVVYALLWRSLGFAITSLLFIGFLSFALAPRAGRSLVKSLLVAALITGVVYFSFTYCFQVPLPEFGLFKR